MAFNFPGNPTIGQKYEPAPGLVYFWTGQAWDRGVPGSPEWIPAGVVAAFAGLVLPAGALWCDGATFDQATFPHLYAALGNVNRTPDLRGRVIVGLDRDVGGFANRVTNTGVGNPGIDAKTMGATGGFDRYTLATAQIPAHQHTGAGTTSGESVDHVHRATGGTGYVSADHVHYGSGTTSGHNTDHSHYVGGATDGQGNHAHTYSRYSGGTGVLWTYNVAPTSARGPVDTGTDVVGHHAHNWGAWTGGVNTDHSHTYSFGTGGISANHSHAIDFYTGGINQNHTHSYNFTSSLFGGGEAHPQMPPSLVLNYIVFTGAPA